MLGSFAKQLSNKLDVAEDVDQESEQFNGNHYNGNELLNQEFREE